MDLQEYLKLQVTFFDKNHVFYLYSTVLSVHDSALHCWHDVIVALMVSHCCLMIMYIWLAHWASDMNYAKLHCYFIVICSFKGVLVQ